MTRVEAINNPIIAAALADTREGETVGDWFDRANESAWEAAGEPDDSPGSDWWKLESEAMAFLEG